MTTNIYAGAGDLQRHRILTNGFIRYEGDWCYVLNSFDYILYLHRLNDNNNFHIDLRKEQDALDFARPRLGFFNLNNKSYWASVQPAKQMQQALRLDQISLWDINQNKWAMIDLNQYKRETFNSVFNGVYPSFQESFQKVKNDWFSCAFSRTLSIVKKVNKKKGNTFLLYHVDKQVGHWNAEENLFIIDETFKTTVLENILNTLEVPYK